MHETEQEMLAHWAQRCAAGKGRSEAEVLAGAAGRINQLRKADGAVRVMDASGKPLAGVPVTVEQTNHAFLFGCNAFMVLSYDDPGLEEAYERQFAALMNYATLGFYWGSYERAPGETREKLMRAQAEWCARRGILTKGHPLIWHEVYPKWGPSDAEETRRLLRARVKSIVSGFAGLVDRWDVVNEASVSANFDNGVGAWARRDGAARLVAEALEWAREANPRACLLYNDYNYWPPDYGFERLAGELVETGAPCDAFGLQSHWHSGERPLNWVWELCEAYARFGKPLHFTEVTVVSGEHGWMRPQPWPTTREGEARQAEYVAALYTLLFSHPAVEAITWWDFPDGLWQGAPAGLVRADLTPKPVYQRLMDLVKGCWWTREELRTGADGVARFRGFLGGYRVVVGEGGRQVERSFTLERGAANELAAVVG